MRAEIISVGDELLSGRVVDTNAAFLARELEALGFARAHRQTVGDRSGEIGDALSLALSRSQVVLFTGGLGPTHDDLTVEAIAARLGAPLVRRPEAVAAMEERFRARGLPMPASNLKQADLPEGAEMIPNPFGTAPGMWWEIAGGERGEAGRLILAFPGVPEEMKAMWRGYAAARLAPMPGRSIASRFVNLAGIGESAAMERLADLLDRDGVKLFPYAGSFEVRVRCLAEAADSATARAACDRAAARVADRMRPYVFGFDDETLESAVGGMLRARGLTVAVAESCTGGLVSHRLTDVPGSSAYVGLNVVTYSYEAKRELLGVPPELLERHGAVSAECVAAMASGIRTLSRADVALALSGIAGPGGGTSEKPVGTLYVALEDAAGVITRRYTGSAAIPRELQKRRFSQLALDLLRRRLAGTDAEG